MKLAYPFTEQEFNDAAADWGCNCGPSALAFALQKPLSAARVAIHEFERLGYTSPTMMKAALARLRAAWEPFPPHGEICCSRPALVRIQFTGPWTDPGANPRWAYAHTHWIATWRDEPHAMVFDCNGGAMSLVRWQKEIAPVLATSRPRSDGGWYPSHVWVLA